MTDRQIGQTNRQTDKEIYRQTNIYKDRQRDRQTNRNKHYTYRQTNIYIDRHIMDRIHIILMCIVN